MITLLILALLIAPIKVSAQSLPDKLLQRFLMGHGMSFPLIITDPSALEGDKLGQLMLPVPQGLTAIQDQTACQVDGIDLKADVFMPAQKSSVARPLILVIHGGAWTIGHRKSPDARGLAIVMASLGNVAVSIEYRMTKAFEPVTLNPIEKSYQTGANYQLQIEDVLCNLRWALSNAKRFGADPNRVAAIGGSSGGHYSLMAGLAANSPNFRKRGDLDPAFQTATTNMKAIVNLFGITDMIVEWNHLTNLGATLKLPADRADAWEAAAVDYMPGTPSTNPLAFAAASPVNYLSKNSPPIITVHGTADQLIPYAEAQELDSVAKRVGASHTLLPVVGGNHALFIDKDGNLIALEALGPMLKSLVWLQDRLGAPLSGSSYQTFLNNMLNMATQLMRQ